MTTRRSYGPLGLLILYTVLVPVSHAQTLTFTFENQQITTTAGTSFFEFDVFVAASASTNLGATLVLVNYDPLGFGTNVEAGGRVAVTQGSLISANADYSLTVNDNTSSRLAIVGFFNFLNPAAIGPALGTTPQPLAHVRMEIVDASQTAGLSFEASLMQGQQYDDQNQLYDAVVAADVANQVLPVEMVSFEVTVDERTVLLQWTTASETGNAGFQVLRTADPREEEGRWETLAFVEGAGTTTEPRVYRYRTEHLDVGRHRFRLKQVDFDGDFAYSEEVEAIVEIVGDYLLSPAYPNPFNPETRFTLAVARAQEVTVEVVDVLGRRVSILHEGHLKAGRTYTFRFQAEGLAGGVYLIRVHGETFMQARSITLIK